MMDLTTSSAVTCGAELSEDGVLGALLGEELFLEEPEFFLPEEELLEGVDATGRICTAISS